MRAICHWCVGAIILWSAGLAAAQDAVPWARSIDEAQLIAAQQGKLVLVHFYGDNCPPCRALEAKVFPRPEFARALTANYVPVKINGNQQPHLAAQYGVRQWPVDVVLSAEGAQLTKPAVCPQDSTQYLAMLDRVADSHRARIDPNVQLAQGIAYDTPHNGARYPMPTSNNATPPPGSPPGYGAQNGPQLPAGGPDKFQQNPYAGQFTPEKTATPPQVGAYDPQGYRPQGSADRIDLRSSFQPPVAGQAYVEGTPYRDPRTQTSLRPYDDPPAAGVPNPQGDPNRPSFSQSEAMYGAGSNTMTQGPATYPPMAGRPQGAPANHPAQIQDYTPRADISTRQEWQQPGYQSGVQVSPPTMNPGPQAPLAGPPMGAPLAQTPTPNVTPGRPAPETAPAVQAPMALEGFCPVTLLESSQWARGDVRYGAIHRGRTYLFASQANQQRFLGNPDKYSPMLSGFDPVKYFEEGVRADGKREFGVVHKGHMYLFTDEDSLKKFWASRDAYIARVQHAMQQSVTPILRR